CRGFRPESPCSHFPPSPLSTLETPPLKLLQLKLGPMNASGATLYACHALAASAATCPRPLSTYSIEIPIVPVLFHEGLAGMAAPAAPAYREACAGFRLPFACAFRITQRLSSQTERHDKS